MIFSIGCLLLVHHTRKMKDPKFSETEGMTISQYVTRKRCSHAANLLKYSDYELSDIAEYFCFSSHSHFGAQFKKVYGMTPSEYRQRYKESGTYSY